MISKYMEIGEYNLIDFFIYISKYILISGVYRVYNCYILYCLIIQTINKPDCARKWYEKPAIIIIMNQAPKHNRKKIFIDLEY